MTGAPKALVVGKPEVTEFPDAVDSGIPEAPTILSGGCLGGHLCADAWYVSTQGNLKRQETEVRWDPGTYSLCSGGGGSRWGAIQSFEAIVGLVTSGLGVCRL